MKKHFHVKIHPRAKNFSAGVYTKIGDKGFTTLLGGKKVSKTHSLIESLGAIDELNSILGVVIAFSREKLVKKWLAMVQNDLFIIQAELGGFHVKTLKSEKTRSLERIIDKLSAKIDLSGFIIPGGSKTSALLHFSRTICRRAEIQTVKYHKKQRFNAEILKYLNRLSDFLYILARWENRKIKEKNPTYS